MLKKRNLHLVLWILGLAVSVFLLKKIDSPFSKIALFWMVLSFFTALTCIPLRTLSINLCALFSIFFVAETMVSLGAFSSPSGEEKVRTSKNTDTKKQNSFDLVEYQKSYPTPPGTFDYKGGQYFRDHWTLGYGPTPGIRVRSISYDSSHLIYDAIYTITSNGLRKTRFTPSSSQKAVLLFGCSFTFGEGVSDSFTFASQLQKELPTHQVYNFGFHGYGPHQMLRILEKNMEAIPLANKQVPTHAFYTSLYDHPTRAAGKTAWDIAGPLYEMNEEGVLQYQGRFNSLLWIKILRQLRKSRLIDFIYTSMKVKKSQTSDLSASHDLKRYFGIVERARDLFEKRYHGKFIVLLWWTDEKSLPKVISGFEARGIHWVNLLEKATQNHSLESLLIPGDGHLNQEANAAIGKIISEQVQKE